MAYTSANYNSISDIEITGLRNQDIMINDSLAINFSLKNGGSNTVNSVVVEWREEGSFRGGTQKFDNIDLKRGTIKEFTFANKYKPVNEGENKIVLKVITVNNEVYNQRSTSDTNYMYVESIRNAVEKNVLIEEATGAWCGHCVDGAWYLKRILQKHKKIIGVALHSGDKMETANTRAACNAMAKGYPSGFVNRTAYNGETGLSRSVWESKSVSQLGQPTTIAINVIPTYNKTTRKLSAKVDVDFTAQKTGNFRVNLYIVENNVTGKGYGWDQSSYYNDVPGHPAYGLGSKIVGYVHNHVVRKMAGGTWGTDGIIPNVANGKYSHTYNVDIKNEWKDKDIHVVAVVSEHGSNTTQRRIFNAIEKPLVAAAPTTTSIELYKGANKIDITKPVVINSKATDSELKYAFNIKNISSKDVEVKLVRETVSATKGHNFYFCWKDCYQPNVAQSSAMTITKGSTHTDEISLHLEPNSTKGLSKYKIKFLNTKDANDKIEVEVHFNVTDNSSSAKSIELYKGANKIDITKPVVINGKATDSELKYAFNIKNISSKDVEVKLVRETVSNTKGHNFYFCWKDCYQPNAAQSSAMTIAKGATHADEISLHLEPNSTKGLSKYKIKFVNTKDANDNIEVEVHFNVTEKSTSGSSIELYNGSDKIDITKPIIINGKATDTELKYTFNVKNISSADVDVILSREAVSAVKEHSFYFCWKDCYLPNITESNAMTITKGSTHADEVSLHLEPKSIEGVSTYKITIKNRDKINDKAEFTVKFNVTGTSTNITSAEGKGIRVYPNPVVDNLMLNGKIDNSNAEPVIFRLYSIEGKLIKHIQLNGYINHMNNSINCSDVPSGIYTYTVSTTDKIYSGRIVKR
jgi:CheY-specific phosphatase CheX